jgi:transcriptional regulator GlxA family with amidase domain
MRRRTLLIGGAAALAVPLIAAPVLLAPGADVPPSPEPPGIDPAEHARTIAAMRPPTRERPVIAIVAFNAATEVTDLLGPFNVLARAGVADVFIVAERAAPVQLYPVSKFGLGPMLFSVDPQMTMEAFDQRWPEGADYVVVPAIDPRDAAPVTGWIRAQRAKGATIVSVCAGALTLGAAGLLDGRRATTHWAYLDDLRSNHPTMNWVPNRRYVADNGIVSATGISASIPTSIALVEAIGGTARAQAVAQQLGVAHWDERHLTSAFQLTNERRKTFIRNWLSFWRNHKLGVPLADGVDEIALAFTADVWSRTSLSEAIVMGEAAVRSLHGLTIRPTARPGEVNVDEMLPALSTHMPAQTATRQLDRIAERFGNPTADIVAVAMEYRWAPGGHT